VAKSLDVGEGLLRRWRDEFAAERNSAFAGSRKQSGLEEENRKLRAEVERLRREREILKTATALFAKEQRRETPSLRIIEQPGRSRFSVVCWRCLAAVTTTDVVVR